MVWSSYLMTQIPNAKKVRETSLGFLVQVLGRRFDGVMKARLDDAGIDIKIFANLMMLMERDGVTQRELGRFLCFPEYHTSRNVDLLVQAGFAERRPDAKSRRSTLVFLTDKGRKKAKTLPKLIGEVNAGFLEALSADDAAQLIGLLQKVALIDENTQTDKDK